ncbi:hypothetical protein N7509_013660 [Penicillium cosmopolitanum]|uniref:Uncharacterized protein n=1 Tax=Penicillium cosmopolitanum TaxID=1131564 RepID=A0A9W9SGE7_9EURO|nr:uncharacterized protein N7509_013660 [Penicillium cosmopolitanum]KAJ5376774.1 hypothetical protein N7509_013660 [Penicillium cosmopolitanum]
MTRGTPQNQTRLRIPSHNPNLGPRPVIPPRRVLPKNPQELRKTKEYKAAARRWTSSIVALPIVMYTSWILYERIYGDKAPKKLANASTSSSSSSS